ncbi:transposase [Streptomyces antimycoticus]
MPRTAMTRCWRRRSGADRATAGIPDQVRHRERWGLDLDMLDQARQEWELPDLPVVADAGYGDATGFREGLTERGLLTRSRSRAVPPATQATRSPNTRPAAAPPVAAYPQPRTTLRALALAAGDQATRTVTWRHGTKW